MENVKGLLHHDRGKTFEAILQSLAELGYALQWQVLNSKDFGVPQHRERVYIVGHLGGATGRQVFPLTKAAPRPAIPSSAARLTPSVQIREATQMGYAVAYPGDSIDISYPNSIMRRGRIGKQTAHTITTQKNHATLSKDGKLRYLTPLECERLQGFPDGWTKEGMDAKGNTAKISDTQRYKCLGNAVSVPVIEAIISRLLG